MKQLPMGRPPKLTDEQCAKLKQWASLGTNLGEVAHYFGVSRTTVRNYLDDKIKARWQMENAA